MAGEQSPTNAFTGNATPARRTNPAADALAAHRMDVQYNLEKPNQPPAQPAPPPYVQQQQYQQPAPPAAYPSHVYQAPYDSYQAQPNSVPNYPPQMPPAPAPAPYQQQFQPMPEPSAPGGWSYPSNPPTPQFQYQQSGAMSPPPGLPPLPAAYMTGLPNPEVEAIQQELQLERLKRQQMEAERAEIDKIRAEMASLKQQAELQKLMQFDDADVDLTNPADLRTKVLAPLVNNLNTQYQQKIDAMQQETVALRTQVQKQQEQMTNAQRLENQALSNEQILTYHPDFMHVQKSQAWAQLMQSRTPDGRSTYGAEVKKAYFEGNGYYVNQLLAYVKGQQPNVAMMAQVSPVMTAQVPSYPQQTQEAVGVLDHNQLADLRQQARATGDRAAFQKAMAQHREAKKKVSVH